MNSNNIYPLLKALLYSGEYISCKENNKKEVFQVIEDLRANVVYILLIESQGKAFLSIKKEAFKDFKPQDIITLYRGNNGIFFPIEKI